MIRAVMDEKRGGQALLRKILIPALRDSIDDLTQACAGTDLLVSHPVTFAGPIVAEAQRLPWVSTVLQPMLYFSAYDPPALPGFPNQPVLRKLPLAVRSALMRVVRHFSAIPTRDVGRERIRLKLTRGGNPLFEGMHSPYLDLALFSSSFASRQPDWPHNTQITGFCFYDELVPGQGLSPELAEFLERGPAPLLFTLGSSAVLDPGTFYEESARAARDLGRRAVLLTGPDPASRARLAEHGLIDNKIVVFDYAPYSQIMPRVSAIVHQGGIGTTAQALRAGRPMLVIPFAHDQPDNAARCERLGGARVVRRREYSALSAGYELRKLLSGISYSERAGEISKAICAEDGVHAACDAIESLKPAASPARQARAG